MDIQQQLSHRLAELQSEILLAEKQKDKLLFDIEQLQNSKSEAIKQYTIPSDKIKDEKAEKTYQSIQIDIEQLQESRKKSLAEYEIVKKQRQEEIEGYENEGKRLHALIFLSEKSLEELIKEREKV